jgi:hypothetical protein
MAAPLTGFLLEDKGPYALTPNKVELFHILDVNFPRGGPVQDPVLTARPPRPKSSWLRSMGTHIIPEKRERERDKGTSLIRNTHPHWITRSP